MRPRLRLPLAAVLLLPLASCGHPDAPPARPDVVVEVREPGATAATPVEVPEPADHAQDDKRAWRLARLFGEAFSRAGGVLEVETADGTIVRIPDPGTRKDGRVLVLTTNRRGEALVAAVLPTDPFPLFHGRGGGRGRQGEDVERVRDVRRLRLVLGPP